jgi:hypothetical protein
MSEISYIEAKRLILEDYENFIEVEGFSPSQSIAATLEDSVLMMKKSHKVYVSVMVNLSILSLKQKILPDYLLEQQENLKELEGLTKEEQTIYDLDISILNQLLSNHKFIIDEDEEYKLRVKMLLE